MRGPGNPGEPEGAARPGTSPPRGGQRDPRSIITPDALHVANALLGTPLATPKRRFAAILIDLVIIGIVTAVTRNFALLLGVVAAIYFIRAGFKRIPVERSVFGRAMRLSVGCLGLFIGFVTLLIAVAMQLAVEPVGEPGVERALGPPEGAPVPLDFRTALLGATGGFAFTTADDEADAEDAAVSLAEVGRQLGLSPLEIRQVLEDLVPEEAEWADRADEVIERALQSRVAGAGAAPGAADSAAQANAADATPPQLAANDSIARLLARIDALDGAVAAARAELAATEGALEEAREGGIVVWLRNVAEDLGFGLGWATLYMTAILPWWGGRTVGKRLMGIRVVRLDGGPITWWTAFERAGGYAAGFATGLLGFAQVYWDANRQGIHDRIVGTVVVRDGVDKVIDWESAL